MVDNDEGISGREANELNRSDGAQPAGDAYSKRNSNWLIWVAVGALLLVTLYALISGFGYAGS
jgi:hypothetical protein